MCCLKCAEDISQGWTESIASHRSAKLMSSHSPCNNWRDMLAKIATSEPRLTQNSCLFPQRRASKWHLLPLVLVQRVKCTSVLEKRPAGQRARGSPGGATTPGCPRLGADLSHASGPETSCSGFRGFSLSPPGPWVFWVACPPQ